MLAFHWQLTYGSLYKFIIYIVFLTSALLGRSQQDSTSGPGQQKNIVQFTGIVFAPDSNSVIPGVHVYVPTVGRGTTTNPYGFFTFPVLEGDSIVFSSIGFKRTHYIVPNRHGPSGFKAVMIVMEEDLTLLDEVEIFPYPHRSHVQGSCFGP